MDSQGHIKCCSLLDFLDLNRADKETSAMNVTILSVSKWLNSNGVGKLKIWVPIKLSLYEHERALSCLEHNVFLT